jgi:hypothetical protein
MITRVNLAQPVMLTIEQMQASLRSTLHPERKSIGHEVYFPAASQLRAAISIQELETPWDSSLQGCRIANFRGSGLRILKRNGNQVEWSEKIDRPPAGLYPDILSQMLDFLTFRAMDLMNISSAHAPQRLVFDLATCVKLIRNTFLDEKKPRVIPQLQWPDRAACVEAMDALVGPWPWEYANYSGSARLAAVNSKYQFEVRGERGAVEVAVLEDNRADALWAAFRHFTRYDYFETEKNFVMDVFHF